jgi:protein-S-isoprenylcysteine O-methyltransferase Ste14
MAASKSASLEQLSTRSAARAILVQAFALFLAAGSLAFWHAWLYLALSLLSALLTNRYLLRHDRALLRRRLLLEEHGEQEPEQKLFITLLIVFGLAMYLVAGLDQRLGWSHMPLSVELLGFVLLVLGMLLVFETFRANSFGASVIQVEAQQTVARGGPYRVVRHPMYTGFLLGSAATPLCLGSYPAGALLLPIVVVFVVRLRAEERYLAVHLPGYDQYLQQTPKRLIPGFW